jgi:CubicO group peptidase (beta-lactamase class C family)
LRDREAERRHCRTGAVSGLGGYDEGIWLSEPGREFRYSLAASPMLRYVVGRVSGQGYETCLHDNILDPLGMTGSDFSAGEFEGRHAIPYTRVGDESIELAVWDGYGSMMDATAADMARFVIALVNGGRYPSCRLLRPETIELMRRKTTSFKTLFESSEDLPSAGRGLALVVLRGGWYGTGGSAPGFHCLLRSHPSRPVGHVILSNFNAILSGDKTTSRRGAISIRCRHGVARHDRGPVRERPCGG